MQKVKRLSACGLGLLKKVRRGILTYIGMEIRVYDMTINANDETGVDFNSFVDGPAHIRSFEMYSKQKVKFAIDEEKRIVTGVFIMADFLIYRRDEQHGEHFVKFSPDTIWAIRNKFFKKGYNVNTNVQHKTTVKGAVLVESYIVHATDPRFTKVPEILAKQKVNDGSWIGSYHIENDALWQDCKNGIFNGFSIEGYFDKTATNIKTNMSKKKKGLFQSIFGSEGGKDTMGEVTTVDGIVLSFEGDLAVGTAVTIEIDGKPTAAPAGDHQVEIDGTVYAVTLDDEGKVATMDEVEAMSEEAEILAEAMRKIVKEAKTEFAEMRKENVALKARVQVLEAGGKFNKDPKKSGEETGKKGFQKILS